MGVITLNSSSSSCSISSSSSSSNKGNHQVIDQINSGLLTLMKSKAIREARTALR
jgi:hypothetical protein